MCTSWPCLHVQRHFTCASMSYESLGDLDIDNYVTALCNDNPPYRNIFNQRFNDYEGRTVLAWIDHDEAVWTPTRMHWMCLSEVEKLYSSWQVLWPKSDLLILLSILTTGTLKSLWTKCASKPWRHLLEGHIFPGLDSCSLISSRSHQVLLKSAWGGPFYLSHLYSHSILDDLGNQIFLGVASIACHIEASILVLQSSSWTSKSS